MIETYGGYSAVGLVNIKNKFNYGGVLRAAQCFEASAIIIQSKRFEKYATNTMKAERHIPTFMTDDILKSSPLCCQKIGVEFTDNSKDIRYFEHPKQALYIFGPEDGSINNEILNKCQHVIKIPSRYCLNLAATVNVVLYDRLLKRIKND